MHLLNADLHCHSTVSDGTLSPEAVAQRARDGGVQLWALTDHDELGGQARARAAAAACGMAWLGGVEISVTFAHETVHIVGLGVAEAHAGLRAGLASVRAGRQERAREMGRGLAAVGIEGAYEGALTFVGNPDLISRTHFARFLVRAGHCANTNAVFHRYLKEGLPGYVPHAWAKLGDAVGWIRAAGGVAVVAHPGRYKFTVNEEYALFSEFREHGGLALEVLTGSHGQADRLKYAETAKEFGLYASRGSDFHSPEESRTDLGSLPDLPGTLKPVWDAPELAERIVWPASAGPIKP